MGTTTHKKQRTPTKRAANTAHKVLRSPLFKPAHFGINNVCKHLFLQILANIDFGSLTIKETFTEKQTVRVFGNSKITPESSSKNGQQLILSSEVAGHHPLHITMEIHHPVFYQKAIFGGSIAIADSYIDGEWDVDDLTGFIRLAARNMQAIENIESSLSKLTKHIEKIKHKRRKNTVSNSKSNILAHYDLGNDMYKTFLDNTMMYSAAIYDTPNTSLADAQEEKLKTLCELLELKEDDTVIEIGTGWGGFALYAAKNYGCHVTTTTISDAQYAEVKARVTAAGLEDKITLLKEDYRNLTGTYDKLMSIEMVEAVGHEYLSTFFKKCNNLIKDDGIMAMQAITYKDQGYEDYINSVDFIQSHIFPGGCLLANKEIIKQYNDNTDMSVTSLLDYGYDYAYTLRDWRHEFMKNLDAIKDMGYDEKFIRLWHFYFAYSEGGFLEKAISVVQVKAIKAGYR